MSQKIYLDDCAYAKDLVKVLQTAGHEVVTPSQAGISGQADSLHLNYAAEHGLVLLTKNPDDFIELFDKTPKTSGSSWYTKTTIPNAT